MLAESGATVVIADINAEEANAHATRLCDAGYRAGAVRIVMANEISITEACAEIVSRFGAPWALVKNAGLQHRELLLDSTPADGPALRTPALGGLPELRDMGAAVLFYASVAARYVTNQVLAVEAGWSVT